MHFYDSPGGVPRVAWDVARLMKRRGHNTAIFCRTQECDYTGTWILRDYGMKVTETTSVETSTIGSLWMLGGYIPVLIGGLAMALIHSFIAWIIRRAWVRNPDRGVFYFSVFFHLIYWSLNLDLLTLWRTALLQFVFAYFGFLLINPFLKIAYAGMAEKYKQYQLYAEHALKEG
jgi:hypothetical protein